MNISWLGQSGFLLIDGKTTIVLDPYLSTIVEDIKNYRRLTPPVMSPDDLRADLLFCSHNHFDHFDPVTVAAIVKNCPECKIYGPASVPERVAKENILILNFNILQPGNSFESGNFKFRALPARHSDPKALGLLIEKHDLRIYFSGDTLYYPELSEEIKHLTPEPIDLALLCINGQGGNMNASEAAHLASELNVKLTIPSHYGMFAENTVEPEYFCSSCHKSRIKTLTLTPGTKYSLRKKNDELFVTKDSKS